MAIVSHHFVPFTEFIYSMIPGLQIGKMGTVPFYIIVMTAPG